MYIAEYSERVSLNLKVSAKGKLAPLLPIHPAVGTTRPSSRVKMDGTLMPSRTDPPNKPAAPITAARGRTGRRYRRYCAPRYQINAPATTGTHNHPGIPRRVIANNATGESSK